jgi:integrase
VGAECPTAISAQLNHILSFFQILRYLKKANVDLMDPQAVRTYIARQSWTPGRRANVIYAYALFAKSVNIQFIIPRINQPQKLPFIPTEREIDDLIARCTKYIATFLQLCKETGARAGEIGTLKWTDVDLEKATVRVAPEKESNPRILQNEGHSTRHAVTWTQAHPEHAEIHTASKV